MTASGITTYYKRPVDNGVGLICRHACVSGRDGVYFVGPEGVYRTTGGEPELLSELIAPIFSGAPSPYYTGGTINRAAADKVRIAYFDEMVYVFVPVGEATEPNRVLVYDTQAKSWTIWNQRIGAAAPFDDPTRGRQLVNAAITDTTYAVRRLDESARTDDETDFLGFWRGGFLDFSDQTVKTMMENKLWGYGLISVRVGTDYAFGSDGFSTLDMRAGTLDRWGDGSNPEDRWAQGDSGDVWGPGAPVNVALARYAVRGTTFSVGLEGLASPTQAPGGWSVSTLTHHVLSPDWATTERHSS